MQTRVKHPEVQILVVVATNQVRPLMTDVEKGSMRTSFGHGLGGPKGLAVLAIGSNLLPPRKGNRLIFRSDASVAVVTQQYSKTCAGTPKSVFFAF